jgi:26 proteasome complex subunit DSS1
VLAYAEWQAKDEDSADKQLWEDEWDDDDISDDFSKQLRAELERAATTPK